MSISSSRTLLLLLVLTFLATTTLVRVNASDAGSDLSSWFLTSRSTGCSIGSMGECLDGISDDDEEFSLDSEISRRTLAMKRYISYGALRRNNVPCSRRGASYYNCRPGASANPYRRGCSAITRCRS